MTKRVEVFIDSVPLGAGKVLSPRPTFLGRGIDMDEDVANKFLELNQRFMLIQGWLDEQYELASLRGGYAEVPPEIEEALWPEGRAESGKKPEKQGTARASKKVSRKRSKKKASTSRTNQKGAS